MNERDLGAHWDKLADDWLIQVGDEGDPNRRLNSDPILWEYCGDVRGLDVVDAGCGTGYLVNQMTEKGARVRGVDLSARMIEIAKKRYPGLSFAVDSASRLATIESESADLVVSNYVLMDLPDLEGAATAFARVLRKGGHAVAVFSHPCFPQGQYTYDDVTGRGYYTWDWNYFTRAKKVDPPWKHFRDEFIWFHRPLSDYWKVFRRAGFRVVEFDEPHLTPDREHLAESERRRFSYTTRPMSVIFLLEKA